MNVNITSPTSELFSKWRKKLLIVGLIFIIVIFITEISYFFLYYKKDNNLVNGLAVGRYLLYFLILPSLFNVTILTASLIINYKTKLSDIIKNYVVSFTLILLCGYTISVHYVFPPLICAICIPIFLTTVFGERRITVYSSLIAFIFMVISFLKAYDIYPIKEISGYFKDDPNLIYNYIIGFLALTCTYIGSKVIITYQKEKTLAMLKSYKRQLELNELLKLDSLTKLYNHSSIYEIIEENLDKYKEIDEFSLAMIDIDNFKSVNDRFGHIHGDAVLASLAQILKKYSNDSIICARYGGEEFAILFVNYSQKEAYVIIDKVRNEFINKEYEFISDGAKITFNCGITNLSRKKISPSEFFRQADIAMYQAKANGKNCIVCYEEACK